MSSWVKRNLKNIIVAAFIIPILLVAFVSISHVTSFYGISNPWSWALYLSVGIEIAALSALAAVSVRMGRFIYIPFLIVTLIQMVGNIFFSFSYIDETSEIFKDWISMVGGIFENMGVEIDDYSSHKFILSFLTGGLLPIISLTFAHMLVKYSEQNSIIEEVDKEKIEEISIEEYEKITNEYVEQKRKQDDELRYKPTKDEIKKIEKILNTPTSNKEKNETTNYSSSQVNHVGNQKQNENQKINQVLQESINQSNSKYNISNEFNNLQSEPKTTLLETAHESKKDEFINSESTPNQQISPEFFVEIKKQPDITKPDEDITNEEYQKLIEDFLKQQKENKQKESIETEDFISPKEDIKEIEVKQEITNSPEDIEENEQFQEVKPEPVKTDEKYKVINYFK